MIQKTLFKENLTQKLVKCMLDLERVGHTISEMTNTDIAFHYYYRSGLPNLARVWELQRGIADGTYPPMESVTRSIRKARTLNYKWEKSDKEDQVALVSNEVGYRDNRQMLLKGLLS